MKRPHHGQIGKDLLELQGAVAGRRELRRQRCRIAVQPLGAGRRRARIAARHALLLQRPEATSQVPRVPCWWRLRPCT